MNATTLAKNVSYFISGISTIVTRNRNKFNTLQNYMCNLHLLHTNIFSPTLCIWCFIDQMCYIAS